MRTHPFARWILELVLVTLAATGLARAQGPVQPGRQSDSALSPLAPTYYSQYDVNHNGQIDIADIQYVGGLFSAAGNPTFMNAAPDYGAIFTGTNTTGVSVGVKGTGTQYGVVGSSTSGNAVFGGNNSTGTAAVAGLNADSGPGVSGLSISGNGVEGTSQGSGFGVKGQQEGGSGVTTGIAAVWGDSNSHAGVYATSNAGTGLFATSNSGTAIYGHSTSGTAIEADGNGASTTALEISNGALKVSGSTRSAFVVTVTDSGYSSVIINNPLTNGDPNALVFITVNRTADSDGPYDISYETLQGCNCWEIHNALNNAIPVGMKFNVLVIKR